MVLFFLKFISEKMKICPLRVLRALGCSPKQKIKQKLGRRWLVALMTLERAVVSRCPLMLAESLGTYPSVLGLQIMLCRDKGQAVCFGQRR